MKQINIKESSTNFANKLSRKVNSFRNQNRRTSTPSEQKPKSRMEMAAQNSPRRKALWEKNSSFGGFSKPTKKKIKKILLVFVAIVCFVGIIGGIWFFAHLQELDNKIGPIDQLFAQREIASVVYDRKGKELYKLFNKFNRDPLDIKDVPYTVRWAFLAAEDVDFYTHPGFDPLGILRCGFSNLRAGKVLCGASTITQQIVKIRTDSSQTTLDRKLTEVLTAIKVEQAYTKDEILQLYLDVAPFGGNVYGLSSASEFYFGKTPKKLTLAEAAILASIVQEPAYLSPTITSDPVGSQKRVKERQEYVLSQLKSHMDQINNQHRKNIDDPEADDLFTADMIDEAVDTTLAYRPPVATSKKAGHAVDFALQELQTKNYKNGEEPFTQEDLQNGGYKIYTTIDYDLQQIAERTALDAVNTYGATYQFRNAALMTVIPKTGEIMSMVGSRNYYDVKEGKDPDGGINCGNNCLFSAQVDVLLTRQSPGSSTKPYAAYELYRTGKAFAGSLDPDIPIDVGGGYSVKNWNSTFFGISPKTTVGEMLRESRNLPAINNLGLIGIPRFLEIMKEFGYTTYNDASQFGPSVILGGADVYPLEHIQGYTAFANQGDQSKVQIIYKIEDRDGNVVYKYKPQLKPVADERAAYMLNETLLNNHGMSSAWGGHDTATKSGTSENSTDAWIVTWSPDMATIAWVGNNNNKNMALNAFGENAVTPWLKGYLRQMSDFEYFANKHSFSRPAGIVTGGGCPRSGECVGGIVGLTPGLMLEGVSYAPDNIRTKIRICRDQPNRLARPIDELVGKAKDAIATRYIMLAPQYQKDLDKYLAQQASKNGGFPNGGPTQYCDIDRTGNVTAGPFFVSPAASFTSDTTVRFFGNAYTTSGAVTQVDLYADCNSAATCTGGKLVGTINSIPANGAYDSTVDISGVFTPYAGASYQFMVKGTDDSGRTNFFGPFSATYGTLPTFSLAFPGGTPPFVWGTDIGSGNSQSVVFQFAQAMTGLNTVSLNMRLNGGSAQAAGATYAGVAGANVTFNGWGGTLPNPGAGKTANYQLYFTAKVNGSTTGTIRTPLSANVTINGS